MTVSNGTSILTSAVAKLVVTSSNVVVAPSITQHPVGQTVTLSDSKKAISATFTVVATGTAPFNYQWRRNGVDLPTETTVNRPTPSRKSLRR